MSFNGGALTLVFLFQFPVNVKFSYCEIITTEQMTGWQFWNSSCLSPAYRRRQQQSANFHLYYPFHIFFDL
uniref:Secreted protein n=1 Tax=Onchocerca volvulus TaxID=6282 RepID=A0A8R1XZY0_ONCVO